MVFMKVSGINLSSLTLLIESEDDYHRFNLLDTTAEMSPAPFFTHPATASSNGLMDWNFSKMLDSEAHITIGSDWGDTSDPSLLGHCAGIVEKVGASKLCRILTLAGAEAVGREREMGSIEVGKKANFIALNKDLSKGEFEGAEVLSTWFEGEIVYKRLQS
jgi:predicted amidohydrolase YtcJ